MKWIKTNYKGVRCREHPTRKHGVGKDKYFAIRYQLGGIRREEGLGWASEGWSAEKASQELAELKKNYRLGEGRPISLVEKRKREEEKRLRAQEDMERDKKQSIPFEDYFENTYFPAAKLHKKSGSIKAEKILFEKWLGPVIGEMTFKDIYPVHLERVKKNMADDGKSPRSIEYAMATFRQVWNAAKRDRLTDRDSPSKEVRIPKTDNRRLRFLSHGEANNLLESLKAISQVTHDIAFISQQCGLRAGEVFSLTWGDVDLTRGLLTLRDTKGKKTDFAIMTEAVKRIFRDMTPGAPGELVFTNRKGKRISQISKTFERTVDKLKLNDGVTDSRQKVVFHTLRHSYASWLVEDGENIVTVKELLRHQNISTTLRYSHVAPGTLQGAVSRLEEKINKKTQKKKTKLKRIK